VQKTGIQSKFRAKKYMAKREIKKPAVIDSAQQQL
jgi:hypothetical protein